MIKRGDIVIHEFMYPQNPNSYELVLSELDGRIITTQSYENITPFDDFFEYDSTYGVFYAYEDSKDFKIVSTFFRGEL